VDVSRRLTSTVIGVTLCGFLVSAAAQASGPVNLYNGGDLHESVGQTDEQPMSSGKPYTARTFPLSVTVRAPDALWGGVQLQSGKFRFIQFHHQKVGKVPLHGWGFVTLETSTGPTPSVAATAQKLHSTPLLEAGPLKAIHVAGFSGKAFDATVSGVDPGNRGISLTPFTTPLHCGFCEDTLHGETLDNKFAGDGQLFRIMVIGVRGKSVVVYLESSFSDSTTRKHPPTETFPTFLPFAQKLLATLSISR
jgi:hypothetical protein